MIKKKTVETLKSGGVGIITTDTILGIVGQAFNKKAVERIYKIKGRNKTKPFIILISDITDLKKFGIRLDNKTLKSLKKYWPGKVSVVLPLNPQFYALNSKLKYLHRGRKSLAFRLPAKKSLREFVKKTGPLVAPSANPEGLPPAKNAKVAKEYFGKKVDFYEKSSVRKNTKPSKLISIKSRKIFTLRG